jgi:NAD(P) transhydrogenase
MIAALKPGSIIVDLAAEAGGNCVATKPGEAYTYKGVTIIGMHAFPARVPLDKYHISDHILLVYNNAGYTDLPSRLPTQSSTLYSNNITKFLLSIGPQGGKSFAIDLEDEVVRGSIVVQNGTLLFPPPKKPTPQVTTPTPAEVPKAVEQAKVLTPWQKASREVITSSCSDEIA